MNTTSRTVLTAAIFALCGIATLAQTVSHGGDGRRFYPDDPLWHDPDVIDVPDVADFELHQEADFLINSFLHPGGDAGPALNINTLGEVPDSSWFTNRIGLGKMSLEDIVRGPDTVDGPAPGAWVVVGRPSGGITPKFTIRDSRGDRYLFKLDPVHLPELPSSVEVISTKIFHALGYNVPEDFVLYLDRSEIRVDPEADWTDESGVRRAITERDVDHWLGKLARVGNREIVIFATCGRDKCSTINNVIAVDPTNTAMHVVNHWEGKTTVVVDGPPDVASFVEERCKSVTCL